MKNVVKRSTYLFVVFFLALILKMAGASPSAQVYTTRDNSSSTFPVSVQSIACEIDWERFVLFSHIHTSWEDNGENVYAMQAKALQHVEAMFPRLLTRVLDAIPSTTDTSLLAFMHEHDMISTALTLSVKDSIRLRLIPDEDLFGNTITYRTQLQNTIAYVMNAVFSQRNLPARASLPGIVEDNYTALVFSVEHDIPLFGKPQSAVSFSPSVFPRVYSEDGTLVYSPEYFQRNTFVGEETEEKYTTVAFRYISANTITPEHLGTHPLIVIPSFVNAKGWEDIVISNEYADRILGSQKLRSYIREGNVFFIISPRKPTVFDIKPISFSRNETLPNGIRNPHSSHRIHASQKRRISLGTMEK